jgi:hypothetical protein
MKNLTITTAIKLGYDFDNASFETIEEMEQEIVNFLNENQDKIKKSKVDFCEVNGHGNSQFVNYGPFNSSGEIVNWSDYYGQRKQRIYHSEFLGIDEKTGEVFIQKLYCFSGGKNTPK